jgi:predicted dehydrogenase
MSIDRRDFIKAASVTGLGLLADARGGDDHAVGAPAVQRRGANARLNVAVIGVNSRGSVLATGLARTPNVDVVALCDVDARVLAPRVEELKKLRPDVAARVRGLADFRRMLDDRDVDAVAIATPDHWHAPLAMLALAAGKHVYLEKPASQNPREGELLVEAQRRHGKVVQVGTQQRSSARTAEVVQLVRDGIIGRPYQARAWYANTRGPIGRGKPAPVPAGLDWELWQGPAPRTPYRDNVVHYNWHWFERWGTGEICNNGNHEIDVARWALGVAYPARVVSSGGRWAFEDDWEFPDTQEVAFEFEGGRQIVWQGRSCNGWGTEGRGRGTSVHGTEGTVVVDRSGYTIYDRKNEVLRSSIGDESRDPVNTVGADKLTALHLANWAGAIRDGATLAAPIAEGHVSTLLCHLGNIAQATGRALRTDPKSGRILGDDEAMRRWGREYAPGWAPAV